MINTSAIKKLKIVLLCLSLSIGIIIGIFIGLYNLSKADKGIEVKQTCTVKKCMDNLCVGDEVTVKENNGVYSSQSGTIVDVTDSPYFYWVYFCNGAKRLYDVDELIKN